MRFANVKELSEVSERYFYAAMEEKTTTRLAQYVWQLVRARDSRRRNSFGRVDRHCVAYNSHRTTIYTRDHCARFHRRFDSLAKT